MTATAFWRRRIVAVAVAAGLCVGGMAKSVQANNWTSGINSIEGTDAYGSLNISGGTNTILGLETYAPPAPSLTVGSLTFSGTASPNLTINSDNVTPGTLDLNGTLTFSGGSGTASITNGLGLTFPGVVNLGASTRTFSINNGTAVTDTLISARITSSGGGLTKTDAGTLVLTAANDYSGSTTITAGTLQLGNGGTTGTLATGSVITVDGMFAVNRSNAVVQGTDFNGTTLTGAGSFIQAGTGITTLNQPNTYGGGTTINGGTLRISNGSGSATGSGAVAINSGGTLAGSGIIVNSGGAVSLNDGGSIAPGINNVGTITTGGQEWNAGGTYVWELDATTPSGNTPGADWDLVEMGTNTLKINATGGSSRVTVQAVQLSPTFTNWGQVALNEWFTIAHAGSVVDSSNAAIPTGSAIAALFDLPTTSFGEVFEIQLASAGGGGFDVQVRVTPEPGSLALVACSAGLLLGRRRRTRTGA